MLRTETKESQANQQQGENAPATKKTRSKPIYQNTGKSKHSTKRRLGADGLPEAAVAYMDHAPVHPVYLHADGLFRPVPHGMGNTGSRVSKMYSMGTTKIFCEWQLKQALNIVDQSVMMFLCQIAAQPNRAFPVSGVHPNTAVLMKSLNAAGLASDIFHSGITTTLPEVARGIGLTATGSNSTAVLESLNRLAATRMRRTVLNPDGSRSTEVGSSNVIGLVCDDNSQSIVLNAELSKACHRSGTVAWVNMREHRAIKSKPAKKLHAWLSNWASTREIRTVDMKLLPKHIWGTQACSAAATKSRLHTLRSCIQEIAALPGWICSIDKTRNCLLVRKPIFAGTKAATAATPTAAAVTPSISAETKTTQSLKSSTDAALQAI